MPNTEPKCAQASAAARMHTQDEIAELVRRIAALENKATAAPWITRSPISGGDIAITAVNERALLAECFEDIRHARERAGDECRGNADFIVSIRNAWPQIKAALESLSKEEMAFLKSLRGIASLPDGVSSEDIVQQAREDHVRVPKVPTMGQWDDFCSVFPVPFELFMAAYEAMIRASIREEKP
jgi:hypothetical protein